MCCKYCPDALQGMSSCVELMYGMYCPDVLQVLSCCAASIKLRYCRPATTMYSSVRGLDCSGHMYCTTATALR
jgi:hypothetical protein